MTGTQPSLPSELCRFRRFAAPGRPADDDNAVYDLLSGRLRFAAIDSFNDPFEARPHFVAAYDGTVKQRAAVLKYLAQLARDRGVPSARAWAVRQIAGKTQQQIVDEVASHDDRKGLAKVVSILCLSAPEAATRPLPWSHYADSHRGVCIHFHTSMPPLAYALPVAYSNESPRILVPRSEQDRREAVYAKLLTKCDDWKYEHEWRCIRQTHLANVRRPNLMVEWDGDTALADPKVVKAVTFGPMMEAAARDRLTQWVLANAPHVELWRGHCHRSRFEVVRERVS